MKVLPDRKSKRRKSKRRKPRVGQRWLIWILFFRYLRTCVFLINARTIAMSCLACVMVYLCQSETLKLRFRVEFSILTVGTVFPVVFSIQQAFSRREEALRNLSILKGLMIGTYLCNRDWDVSDGVTVRANLGNDESPHAVRCAQLIHELLRTLRRWLSGSTPYESESEWRMLYGTTGPVRHSSDLVSILVQLTGAFLYGKEGRKGDDSSDESEDEDYDRADEYGESSTTILGKSSKILADRKTRDGASDHDKDKNGCNDLAEELAERDPHWRLYFKLYDIISKINVHNEKLMGVANCTKSGEAGMSRLAAYISKTAEIVERLRYLREYRTPFMLRYVSFTLVIASIVMAAPYFAFMCVSSRWEDDTTGTCPAGYFTAVLYVLVLSTLFHVQVALENPFDGIGVDDVFVNMDREFAVTVRRYVRSRAAEAKEAAASIGETGVALGAGGRNRGVDGEGVVKSGASLPSSMAGTSGAGSSVAAVVAATSTAAPVAAAAPAGGRIAPTVVEAWQLEDAF